MVFGAHGDRVIQTRTPFARYYRKTVRLYFFDDSGVRTRDQDRPCFIVGGFGIDADEYRDLQEKVRDVTSAFGIDLSFPTELKSNNGGRVGKYPQKNHLYRAGLTEIHERKAVLLSVLHSLQDFESVRAIAVVNNNLHYLPKRERHPENTSDAMADLIAGGISRWANSEDPSYTRYIWPLFRNVDGDIHGVGLKSFRCRRLADPTHANGLSTIPRCCEHALPEAYYNSHGPKTTHRSTPKPAQNTSNHKY